MSLSGNTEKINALISAINALPEAGSGGDSGGANVSSGMLTIGTGTGVQSYTTRGETVASVSGLGFTPTQVVVFAFGYNPTSSSTSQQGLILSAVGENTCTIAAGYASSKQQWYNSTSTSHGYSKAVITNDGFDLVTPTSSTATTYKFAPTYYYIAMG